MRQLLDPRLGATVSDGFPSRCTIQSIPKTAAASGQPVLGVPVDVDGMTKISCRIGPLILIRPTDNENRTNRIQESYLARQLKLDGYFPAILVRDMQAVVDGITYPIRGVEHDGNQFSTRLRLEVIKP